MLGSRVRAPEGVPKKTFQNFLRSLRFLFFSIHRLPIDHVKECMILRGSISLLVKFDFSAYLVVPDVPPFGNPFVFAFAYRCSQIRLRIHPFRTAVGRREQQPSCQTVMAETSSASLFPEVPRSLSDRTRVITIGIWNFSKTTTYHSTPPLFQNPAIQTGLARSPAKAGKGKLQTRHGRE